MSTSCAKSRTKKNDGEVFCSVACGLLQCPIFYFERRPDWKTTETRLIYCLIKPQSRSKFASRCHILTMRLWKQYKLGLIAYKIITGVELSYLCDMVRTRQHRVAGCVLHLLIKMLETIHPEKTTSDYIRKFGKNLRKTLRDTTCANTFRRNLKNLIPPGDRTMCLYIL